MRLSVGTVISILSPSVLGSLGPELKLSMIPDQVSRPGVGSGSGASGVIGLWCGSPSSATISATGITVPGGMFAPYARGTFGATITGKLERFANACISLRSGDINCGISGGGGLGPRERDTDSSFRSSRLRDVR